MLERCLNQRWAGPSSAVRKLLHVSHAASQPLTAVPGFSAVQLAALALQLPRRPRGDATVYGHDARLGVVRKPTLLPIALPAFPDVYEDTIAVHADNFPPPCSQLRLSGSDRQLGAFLSRQGLHRREVIALALAPGPDSEHVVSGGCFPARFALAPLAATWSCRALFGLGKSGALGTAVRRADEHNTTSNHIVHFATVRPSNVVACRPRLKRCDHAVLWAADGAWHFARRLRQVGARHRVHDPRRSCLWFEDAAYVSPGKTLSVPRFGSALAP